MDVQKRDREKDAVRGFTFTFTFTFTNGVYGLLGENGAGKTTLMRLISDVKDKVKEQFGVTMEPEVKRVGRF